MKAVLCVSFSDTAQELEAMSESALSPCPSFEFCRTLFDKADTGNVAAVPTAAAVSKVANAFLVFFMMYSSFAMLVMFFYL